MRSFAVAGPVISNSLPAALRTATLSPLTFAWHLKAHLFGWSAARLRTIDDALYKSTHHHHHHHHHHQGRCVPEWGAIATPTLVHGCRGATQYLKLSRSIKTTLSAGALPTDGNALSRMTHAHYVLRSLLHAWLLIINDLARQATRTACPPNIRHSTHGRRHYLKSLHTDPKHNQLQWMSMKVETMSTWFYLYKK